MHLYIIMLSLECKIYMTEHGTQAQVNSLWIERNILTISEILGYSRHTKPSYHAFKTLEKTDHV